MLMVKRQSKIITLNIESSEIYNVFQKNFRLNAFLDTLIILQLSEMSANFYICARSVVTDITINTYTQIHT